MGLMDELKKLTQPFDDEDDVYEGADESFAPKPKPQQAPVQEEADFENAFAEDTSYVEPEPQSRKPSKAVGSIFKGAAKPASGRAPKASRRSTPAAEASVVLFNPKTFDEAGELVTYLSQGRSLVMALEGVPMDTARRILDFISGIAFALNAKITPVSSKTYFITPENVDLLDPQKNPVSQEEEQF